MKLNHLAVNIFYLKKMKALTLIVNGIELKK